jgi:hypothetical protein
VTIDRVKPLKIESIASGGDENDEYPSSLNPEEDHVECAGLVLDAPGLIDESTVLDRNGNDMRFKDTNNPAPITLSTLVAGGAGGITETSHKTLRQLIHLADGEGPFEGFTSGAYKVTSPTGPFPTSIIWYDKADEETRKKIVEKNITWTGAFPTTIVWKVYDATETLLATVTDTISYSGPFETSRTRAVA